MGLGLGLDLGLDVCLSVLVCVWCEPMVGLSSMGVFTRKSVNSNTIHLPEFE